MDKPDFGIGTGGLHVIKWTTERKAYLDHCAKAGMSAAEFAVHIGLKKSQSPRISEASRRFGIKLNGVAGRRPGTICYARLQISRPHQIILRGMAEKRAVPAHDLLSDLVRLIFEQGETFLANLLDEE